MRCQALDTCGVVINHETTEKRKTTDDLMMTPMTVSVNDSSNTSGDIIGSTINALGVLTGLLAAALAVVIVGWIVSCVYWQRRDKQRCVVLCDIPFLFYQTER